LLSAEIDIDTGRQIDEVQRVGLVDRQPSVRNLDLDQVLDLRVRHRARRLLVGDYSGAGEGPMRYRRARHRVFAELIHQRAVQNVCEEIVELREERGFSPEPFDAPERCEDFHRAQQGPAAICELRWRGRRGCRRDVKGNDSDR
jgi:hypothetical protein